MTARAHLNSVRGRSEAWQSDCISALNGNTRLQRETQQCLSQLRRARDMAKFRSEHWGLSPCRHHRGQPLGLGLEARYPGPAPVPIPDPPPEPPAPALSPPDGDIAKDPAVPPPGTPTASQAYSKPQLLNRRRFHRHHQEGRLLDPKSSALPRPVPLFP